MKKNYQMFMENEDMNSIYLFIYLFYLFIYVLLFL
jgi:hypothetical protein